MRIRFEYLLGGSFCCFLGLGLMVLNQLGAAGRLVDANPFIGFIAAYGWILLIFILLLGGEAIFEFADSVRRYKKFIAEEQNKANLREIRKELNKPYQEAYDELLEIFR